MASKTRQVKHARPRRNERDGPALASSSLSAFSTKHSTKPKDAAPNRESASEIRFKSVSPCKCWSNKVHARSRTSFWFLRSLLVALLLVPYVSALPSPQVLSNGRREGVESVSTRGILPPIYAGSLHTSESMPRNTVRSGYLGSNHGKGKQRETPSQGFLSRFHSRRDAIFPAVAPINGTNTTDNAPITVQSTREGNRTLTVVFEHADGTDQNVTVEAPTDRWGHTSTYLPSHNIVLLVGGQTSLEGDITNDVYALDVSQLNDAAGANSSTSDQNWQRLSSEGLPAHAFAASTVMQVDGQEKLWIVGGVTQNCAIDAPAYVWSAPAGNFKAGKWTAVRSQDGSIPVRRKGAQAVSLSSNSSSILVSGGSFDSSTCASSNGTYAGVDIWSPTSSPSLSNSADLSPPSTALSEGNFSTSGAPSDEAEKTELMSVESLALDQRMHDFSLIDYTTVQLPANGNCSEKVLFLGGKDQSGNMAPLSNFWALDLATGNWERWNATGRIPSGRMGHTAVLTPDGKVIIHGGYLEDPSEFTTDNDPVDEVFILDPTQNPSRWDAAVWTAQSSLPPALAYHSSVMAGDVMIVSFGQQSYSSSSNGRSFAAASLSPAAVQNGGDPVHFLDTSTLSTGGGFTWSNSISSVAESRQAVAQTVGGYAPVTAPGTPSTIASPSEVPAVQQHPVASATNNDVTQSQNADVPSTTTSNASPDSTNKDASRSETAAPVSDPSADPSSSDKQGSDSSSNSHTGAIAGSLLGAAAVAAAVGGIYAYRKRKEAEAYNLGRHDSSRDLDDDEEKNHAPPVSSLYLNHPSSAAGPTVAAASGWTAKLKRAASSIGRPLNKSTSNAATLAEAKDKYTQPVVTMRNGAPRGRRSVAGVVPNVEAAAATASFGAGINMGGRSDLPDDFITRLAEDDSPHAFSHRPLGRNPLPSPRQFRTLNPSMDSLHTIASSSQGSHGGASHFSYPYLSGMHRSSAIASSDAASMENGHQNQRVRVIVGTPESLHQHPGQIYLSPGDIVSPYHMPKNPHCSPESVFLDLSHCEDTRGEDDDEEDVDTTISLDGVSAVPAFHQDEPQNRGVDAQQQAFVMHEQVDHIGTPLFPWSTPTIAPPPPVACKTSAQLTNLRSKPSALRVTNLC